MGTTNNEWYDGNKQLEYIKISENECRQDYLSPTTMSKTYESTIKSIDVPVVMLGQEGSIHIVLIQ